MSGWTLDARLAADTVRIGSLALSELLLMNDARWPWLILVPRVPDRRELIDLSLEQQTELLSEVNGACRALQTLFAPSKLNVAALGNVVAQLHVHVIARHAGDPAWPKPVWGMGAAQSYDEEALRQRIAALRSELASRKTQPALRGPDN